MSASVITKTELELALQKMKEDIVKEIAALVEKESEKSEGRVLDSLTRRWIVALAVASVTILWGFAWIYSGQRDYLKDISSSQEKVLSAQIDKGFLEVKGILQKVQ